MDKNYDYKHKKGFIITIFITFIISISTCYGQVVDSVTGNLINTSSAANAVTSTWQGVGSLNNGLPCWSPEDPGYCGPNAYANTNSLNFSYGLSNVYQNVNVAKALPYSGAGLITTGFKFGWMSKNGNGWEPETKLDTLSAYVTLYDKGNKEVENFYWDLNYIHSWTTFNYDKNFSKPYRPNDVSNIRFGFIGMDSSNWAGPYGPEVTNITFELKYKPDPCVKNSLVSPDCPKFTEELAKITSTSITNVETTNTYDNHHIKSDHDINKKESNFTMGEKEEGVFIHENDRFIEQSSSKLDSIEFALNKIFDAQLKQEEQSLDIANTAVIKTEQQTKEVLRTSEQKVSDLVNQHFKDVQNITIQTITEQTKQNNISIESIIKGAENSSNITQFQLQGNQNNSIVTLLQDNKPQNTVTQPQLNNTRVNQNINLPNVYNQTKESNILFDIVSSPQIPPNMVIDAPLMSINQITSQPNITTNIEIFLPPVILATKLETQITQDVITPITNTVQTNIEQFTLSKPIQNVDIPTITSNFLINKADPLNDILVPKTVIKTESNTQESTQTVKTNAVDNDVAGNVSIQTIAVSPVGFNQYTNFILRDVAFYAPKEIYRSQRTVDNTRALRNLASDRLHQDMVDLQYRR